MTSPVASIDLTYDGTDLQHADLGLFLEIVSGLSADGLEVRGRDVTIPSLAGQVARNRVGHSRRIELAGHVMGNGATQTLARTDYRHTMDLLAILFDPTRDPAALVATLEDGGQVTIDARPLPGLAINEVILSEYARVSVVLESVDPDWVAVGS